MADVSSRLRTGNSPARGVPVPVTVAINNSSMVIAPASAGHIACIDGGSIVAAADCSVTVRRASAAGPVILTLPLAARQPVPMSIFALFGAVDEALYIVTTDAVNVTGRVIPGYA